jgi:hypothetical protein
MMPRKKKPGCWNHRPSGQAYVRIDGKDHYLRPYDSPESRDRYEELIQGWTLNQSPNRFAITCIGRSDVERKTDQLPRQDA